MARRKKAAANRGSEAANAKRKAARALNQLFAGVGTDASLDGRTLKRKRRLLSLLVEGREGRPLKALESLSHATELLSLGETLASLRKLKPKVPPAPPLSEQAVALYREAQQMYSFDPRAWRLLGVDIAAVVEGGAGRKGSGRRRR